jgi:hypothetical protein
MASGATDMMVLTNCVGRIACKCRPATSATRAEASTLTCVYALRWPNG